MCSNVKWCFSTLEFCKIMPVNMSTWFAPSHPNIMMVIQMRFNNRQQNWQTAATIRLDDGGQIIGLVNCISSHVFTIEIGRREPIDAFQWNQQLAWPSVHCWPSCMASFVTARRWFALNSRVTHLPTLRSKIGRAFRSYIEDSLRLSCYGAHTLTPCMELCMQ